jgi:hypothetical protein
MGAQDGRFLASEQLLKNIDDASRRPMCFA